MTKEQILGAIHTAGKPMHRKELEQVLGVSYRKFQGNLDYYKDKKRAWIVETDGNTYTLTEKGVEELLRVTEFEGVEDDVGLRPTPDMSAKVDTKEKGVEAEGSATKETQTSVVETSEESLGTTEYQQFLKFGRLTGVFPLALIKQTAEHIWNGGDYKDLKWVAEGLAQMGIRSDLLKRWFHSWRSYLKMGIPTDFSLDEISRLSSSDGKGGAQTGAKNPPGKRDYILSEDDLPVRVGDGAGDMDYDDAMQLAKIRAARGKGTTAPQSVGTMADEITKIFRAFKETMGDRGEKVEGKNWMVKPAEGGYKIEEVEPGKPILVPQQEVKASPSYIIKGDGTVQEITPGKPVIIVKEPQQASKASTHYLVDNKSGEVKEVAAGQPIVIIKEPQQQNNMMTPISVTDKDGKPMILDLSTYIRLEEHKEKKQRDQDAHETKMQIAQEFKSLLKKAGTALGNMAEGE